MQNNPIGIFDSGVGGLTVWHEVRKKLPHENTIYFADSANCPYGNKTKEEIIQLSIKNTEFLLSKGCKLIIVACNTATAAAIETLRKTYKIPFVGMEPAIKPAALLSKSGKIGVLATKGTFNGDLFKKTSAKYANHIEIITQIGAGLVEMVENDELNTLKSEELIKIFIYPMLDRGVDKIVLGCTHYPFFRSEIQKVIPKNVEIIDPAPAIAQRSFDILNEALLLNNTIHGETTFFTNGKTEIINKLAFLLSNQHHEIHSINNLTCTN